MTELRVDQWQSELDRIMAESKKLQQGGAGGFASEDAAKHWGVSQSVSSNRIGKLIDDGMVEYAGKQTRANRTGSLKQVPVYRLKATKKQR